jgi:hypothetical protein
MVVVEVDFRSTRCEIALHAVLPVGYVQLLQAQCPISHVSIGTCLSIIATLPWGTSTDTFEAVLG